MSWLGPAGAVVVTLSLATAAQADVLDLFGGGHHDGGKCCADAEAASPGSCQPACGQCGPARKPCFAPPKTHRPEHEHRAPPHCYAPEPVPHVPKQGCCRQKECCQADPGAIAQIIYIAQTAHTSDEREDAIDELGDYDCTCYPEIISAMVYALNDPSAEVRAEAADELGDVLGDNPCCASQDVIAALKCALSDHDDDVREQAEEALDAFGYTVVGACCDDYPACGGCDIPVGNGLATPEPRDGEITPPPPAQNGNGAPTPTPEAVYPAPAPRRLRHSERPLRSVRSGLVELFRKLD